MANDKNHENEEQIIRQLKDVQDRQLEHQQALKRQEQLERDVDELNKRSRQLFRDLNETWSKDRFLASTIAKHQSELNSHEQKIESTLENRREDLLKEKRELYDWEEDLYYQKRQIAREEDEK